MRFQQRLLAARTYENWADRSWPSEGATMSEGEAFDRILASLHDVALDRGHWSTATALIDEALRTHGSSMAYGAGRSGKDIRIYSTWCFHHGQRRQDLEREYYECYYPVDERVPRARNLPDSRLFHITDLLTEAERKSSLTYNEMLPRGHAQNSVTVRLAQPDGSRIIWVVNDPLEGDGWSSAQLDLIRRLLPHFRQSLCTRHALAGAGVLGASLTKLLDFTGLGIVQLDGRGRIVAANDRARDLLRSKRLSVRRRRIPVCPRVGGQCQTPGTLDAGAGRRSDFRVREARQW